MAEVLIDQDGWRYVSDVLPPEGVVVDTVSPTGGVRQPLKRSGRLWFTADGAMYVYYTPQLWRVKAGLCRRCVR